MVVSLAEFLLLGLLMAPFILLIVLLVALSLQQQQSVFSKTHAKSLAVSYLLLMKLGLTDGFDSAIQRVIKHQQDLLKNIYPIQQCLYNKANLFKHGDQYSCSSGHLFQLLQPSTNGCGPGNPLWALVQIVIHPNNFNEVCDLHDFCYDTCGMTKKECDDQMWDNLVNFCIDYLKPDWSWIFSFEEWLKHPFRLKLSSVCFAKIRPIWLTMVAFSQSSFDQAQNMKCTCAQCSWSCP